MDSQKRKLWFTFWRGNVLTALPAIPLRDIPATGVGRPCSFPRFARQRHGTHVLLQGRQIAFKRLCCHPRTSRPELSCEARNCHLKPSNRSSDSLNNPLNSSSQSIANGSARDPAAGHSRDGRWTPLQLPALRSPASRDSCPPPRPPNRV